MRVLFMDQYREVGGGQTILLNLIESALSAHQVSLMIPLGGELEKRVKCNYGDRIDLYNLKEIRLTSGKKNFWDIMKTILYAIIYMKYLPVLKKFDVVYVNGPRLFLPALLLSLFLRNKFIYHIHLNHSYLEKIIINCLERRPNTAVIVINSGFILESLRNFSGNLRDSDKMILIENSLPADFSKLNFVDRFREGRTGFNIVVIGRISSDKGQDVLVRLSADFPQHSFFVVGDNDFESQDYKIQLQQKAGNKVFFMGKSDNIIRTLNEIEAQLSLVPSVREEAFGLTAIESMSCSCITITTLKGELRNIAKKTSAYTYSQYDELCSILLALEEMNNKELAEIAHRQYSQTIETYHYQRFKEAVSNMLGSTN